MSHFTTVKTQLRDLQCLKQAIEDGYVSVTPLHLDLTNYDLLEEIRGWGLTL